MIERGLLYILVPYNDRHGIIPGWERCRVCRFTLAPITKVLGGRGVGFGEGRGKPFFRKVPSPLPQAPTSLPPKTFDIIESLLAVFPDMKRGERLGGIVAEPVAQRGNRLFSGRL